MKYLRISFFTVLVMALMAACVPQQGGLGTIGYQPFGAQAVTTSLDDSLAIEEVNTDNMTVITENIDLSEPGYYRYNTRSYCLHAGKHGASGGEGYLIAPLRGSQAPLISSIIRNSHSHRNIKQSTIQRIIWAIEAGSSLRNFSGAEAAALAQLASSDELATYELKVQAYKRGNSIARSLLPAEAKNALDFYESFNNLVTDANRSFEEVERVAVLTGAVPPGPGSRNVKSGNWAKVCEGTFIRTFPNSYSNTTVEVFVEKGSSCAQTVNDYSATLVSTPGNTSRQRLLTDWSYPTNAVWIKSNN